jgi:DNA-binding PadR family transcriptional regulator
MRPYLTKYQFSSIFVFVNRPRNLSPEDLTIAELTTLLLGDCQGGIHGYELAEKLDTREAKTGAVYRRLGALADRGFLSSAIEAEETANTHSGPARRIYHTTEEGQAITQQALKIMGIQDIAP